MAIPHSRLFDAEWYLTQNPDVAAAVQAGLITAHDHFSQFGIDENRSPSPLFDPGFYLTQSPDVAAAVAAGHFSAVQHFLLYGQREARAISPFIDLGKYLNANPIRMAGEDVKEGRKRQNANAAAIVTGLFA